MNDNAAKWVEALKSGEFKQAQKQLRNDDAYCCLGVACELYRREHESESYWEGNTFIFGDFNSEESVLPKIVQDWLGVTSETCFVDRADSTLPAFHRTELTGLNDEGSTFEQIAAIIESEPEGLFI